MFATQTAAARQIGCNPRTVRRWIAEGFLSADAQGRVRLSQVQEIAARQKTAGRRRGSLQSKEKRERAIRILACLLTGLKHDAGNIELFARFWVLACNCSIDYFRKSVPVLPIENELLRRLRSYSTVHISVLSARLLLEMLEHDQTARPIRPTQGQLLEAERIVGGPVIVFPNTIGAVKLANETDREAMARVKRLAETRAWRKVQGVEQTREGKSGYTLGQLLGTSRRMACYWRKRTNARWVEFKELLRESFPRRRSQNSAYHRQQIVCLVTSGSARKHSTVFGPSKNQARKGG